MLIRNEKSRASFFSTPASSPHTSVDPLLEIPGKIAIPCASPMYSALDFFIGLLPVRFKSAIIRAIAENKNPQMRVLVEKLSSMKRLNIKTIKTVGIVAIIKFKFVLLNGWRTSEKIFSR